MSDINKFTTKEVLNKVLLDSSGNAVEAFSHTTQEALNAALDTTNNRLNVSLNGGTISGDVTISGDLTVQGGGSLSFDEIIEGTSVIDVTSTEAFLVRKDSDGGDVFIVDTTNGNVGIGGTPYSSYGSNFSVLSLNGTKGGAVIYQDDGVAQWSIRTTDDNTLRFNYSSDLSSEAMRIDSSGNVGIGDSSPDAKLTISDATNDNLRIGTRGGNMSLFSVTDAGGASPLVFEGSEFQFLTGTEVNIQNATTDRPILNIENQNADNSPPAIHLYKNSSSPANNDQIGDLSWYAKDDGGTKTRLILFRGFQADVSASSDDSKLSIYTTKNGIETETLTLESGDATFGGDVTIKTDGTSNDPATLALWSADTSIADNDNIGVILAQGSDSGGSPPYLGAKIEFNADANWDTGTTGYYPTRIDFFTESNSGTISTANPALTIDSSQNATFAGDVKLGVNKKIYAQDNSTNSIEFYNGATGAMNFVSGTASYDYPIEFRQNDAQVMTIKSQRVGIGTQSPAQGQSTPISDIKLDVAGNQMLSDLSTTNTDQSKLFFFRSDGAVGSQGQVPSGLKIGAVEWTTLTDADDNNSITSARIEAEASNVWDSASNRNAKITFSTVSANSLGTRFVLDENSRISLSNNDSGTANTVFGRTAGDSIASGGNNNTLFGFNAGSSITTGDGNVLLGYRAGETFDTNGNNVGIGSQALGGNGNASKCIAIGATALSGALSSSTDGAVAVGHNTLQSLTTGSGNTAIGYQSMDALTVGISNVALGYGTLTTEVEGQYNTAIGYQALRDQNGGGSDGTATTTANTALGWRAGYQLTTGTHNTFLGRSAGDVLTTGGSNVIIGSLADASADSGANQIVIGYNATGLADNTVTLGNSSITDVFMAQDGEATIHTAGVKFPPNNALPDSNVNTLDDYEEGTYTATATPSTSGSITLDGSANELSYVKIGSQVTVNGLVYPSAVSSPVGHLKISLPFSIGDKTDFSGRCSGSVTIYNSTANIRDFVLLGVEGDAFVKIYLGDATSLQSDSADAIDSDTSIAISVTYFV